MPQHYQELQLPMLVCHHTGDIRIIILTIPNLSFTPSFQPIATTTASLRWNGLSVCHTHVTLNTTLCTPFSLSAINGLGFQPAVLCSSGIQISLVQYNCCTSASLTHLLESDSLAKSSAQQSLTVLTTLAPTTSDDFPDSLSQPFVSFQQSGQSNL